MNQGDLPGEFNFWRGNRTQWLRVQLEPEADRLHIESILTGTGGRVRVITLDTHLNVVKIDSVGAGDESLVIIVLCLARKRLVTALAYGVLSGVVVSLIFGVYKPADLLAYPAPFAIERTVLPHVIPFHNFYSWVMLLMMIFAIVLEYGSKKEVGCGTTAG